jgi:hypothetical protein
MADVSIIAPRTRPSVRGRLHWKHYNNTMPPAITITNADGTSTKVFEWRMLLKDIDGRQKLVESSEGETKKITEGFLDICDVIRTKWLLKTYGVKYFFRPGKGFSLPKDRPRFIDTWHTRTFSLPLSFSLSLSALAKQQTIPLRPIFPSPVSLINSITTVTKAAEVDRRRRDRQRYSREQESRWARIMGKLLLRVVGSKLGSKINTIHAERKLFGSAMVIGLQLNEQDPAGIKLLKYVGGLEELPAFLARNVEFVEPMALLDYVEVASLGQLKGGQIS